MTTMIANVKVHNKTVFGVVAHGQDRHKAGEKAETKPRGKPRYQQLAFRLTNAKTRNKEREVRNDNQQ